KLCAALLEMGHSISPNSVRKLLTQIGFSRQVNRKAVEGASHPDRDAQFEYINAQVLAAQAADQPVISVDTKKKELVGLYKNAGGDWRPKGDPTRVKVHDFEDKALGKVAPYGVAATTTRTGLGDAFHPEWNYEIIPRNAHVPRARHWLQAPRNDPGP